VSILLILILALPIGRCERIDGLVLEDHMAKWQIWKKDLLADVTEIEALPLEDEAKTEVEEKVEFNAVSPFTQDERRISISLDSDQQNEMILGDQAASIVADQPTAVLELKDAYLSKRAPFRGVVTIRKDKEDILGEAVNMSANGIFMATDSLAIQVGEVLPIIVTPSGFGKSFVTQAKIVRASSKQEKPGYGLEFI